MNPPILWSRELWDDQDFTEKVNEYEEGDILLFGNNKIDAYWWHIGVSLGGSKLIHLSKEVGFPEIITYQYLLGAKRLK